MNKKTQATLFSSRSVEWETPQDFFDNLNKKWNFTLDPCSTDQNHKCVNYFTKSGDGLTKNWGGHSVFMNPPYGREIADWIKKAYEESRKPNTLVACLIPARTDTKYWHRYCMNASEIYFIEGRLQFNNITTASKAAAPFPNAVVVFDSSKNTFSIGRMDKKANIK